MVPFRALPEPVQRIAVLAKGVEFLVPEVGEIVLVELEHALYGRPVASLGAPNIGVPAVAAHGFFFAVPCVSAHSAWHCCSIGLDAGGAVPLASRFCTSACSER